jgi:hypothetical protein
MFTEPLPRNTLSKSVTIQCQKYWKRFVTVFFIQDANKKITLCYSVMEKSKMSEFAQINSLFSITLNKTVKSSHIFQTIGSQMRVSFSASRIGRPPFTRQEDFCYSFQLRGWVDPRAISNDLIGNRTLVLLGCSIVSQWTALLRAPREERGK